MTHRIYHLSIATLAVLCACHAPQQRDYDQEVPLEVPEAWNALEETEAVPDLERWWEDFGDSQLTKVVDEVLAQNYDLQAATARLQAASAQARIAGAQTLPTASVGGNAGRQRQNIVGFPTPGGDSDVLSFTTNSYGVSFDVGWELDLWGKLDARVKGAEATYAANEALWYGVRLSLAGQAVKTWLALCELGLQRDLAAERVRSTAQSTEVLRERFRSGRSPALDLRLSEVQLASAEAQHSSYLETLERVQRELEILMGDYPAGELEASASLPALPGMVPVGLPSELLQRRPDLAAARQELKSNDYYLYAARKDLWPSIGLNASVGRRGAGTGDLFDDDFSIWSLAGSFTQPIFQGGRLDANIDLEDANVRATLAQYGQAILQAFLEVETAFAVEESLVLREQQLALAAEYASGAQSLAEDRYYAGRQDILTMLSARSSAFNNQSAWISARREQLDRRVDLYLALGGGFDAEPTSTAPSSR
ncbi:MAG: multidrug efflux system outer membrane protein [Planctomycetota bacterium]|jgi:multidrug efflux system outer membrane protein